MDHGQLTIHNHRNSMPPRLPSDFRSWFLRGLAAWGGATFVIAVAGVLWGLLSLLGDESGAAVARGIIVFAACGWLLAMAGLVGLLCWERLATHDRDVATPSPAPSPATAAPPAATPRDASS